MTQTLTKQLLLQPENVQPLHDGFSVLGVFNPGAIEFEGQTVLAVRVAETPTERRPAYVSLPRYTVDGQVVVDWQREDELDLVDTRVVRKTDDNLLRLTSISHLQFFCSRDGVSDFTATGTSFLPQSPFEEYGVEDPRITQINDTYWITYVAVSRHGAATAVASTRDFLTFERHGVIFCPENKDVVLFPRRVDGHYIALHRPNPHSQFGRPQMWIAHSPDLIHWGEHNRLYAGHEDWEGDRVGAGTPPIEIAEGWLEIYHGSRRSTRAGEVGAYSAGALLLDRDDPSRVLKRSIGPLLQPTEDFERAGFVDDVVFPTGIVQHGDAVRVYYGAADAYVGLVEFSVNEIVSGLR